MCEGTKSPDLGEQTSGSADIDLLRLVGTYYEKNHFVGASRNKEGNQGQSLPSRNLKSNREENPKSRALLTTI